MNEHICRLGDPWPISHPLPVEDPAKLTGPEVGSHPIFINKTRTGKYVDGVLVCTCGTSLLDGGLTISHVALLYGSRAFASTTGPAMLDPIEGGSE